MPAAFVRRVVETEIKKIKERLNDPNWRNRLNAAFALAKSGLVEETRTVYLNALKSEVDGELEKSIGDLAKIGASWAVDSLGDLLANEDSNLRWQAIVALADIARARVARWLILALQDEDDERCEDARAALKNLFGDDVPTAESSFVERGNEYERVTQWWQANSSRFHIDTCYQKGKLLSLRDWIVQLKGSPEWQIVWLTNRLLDWTGVELGPNSEPALAERWQQWWQKNSHFYTPGVRYFWGRPVT